MASDLEVFPIALPGGINESSPFPEEQDLEELENFGIFRNRIGLRAPITLVGTILDDQGSPAEVDAILDIVEHNNKLYCASWSGTTQKVYLHSMQVDGTSLTLEAVLWTSVVTQPVIKLTSFTGGTAETNVSRLYASDYNQSLATVYWNGTTVTTLTADLNNDTTSENVTFSLMAPFKFHLWGSGFFEGSASFRPELLRFSQPGLVPGSDPSGGAANQEWFSNDHRSLGRRGDKITGLGWAGDRLVVFQKRATHVIYGSGATTWTRQQLSHVVGAVGPFAHCTVDGLVCYFWASDGPYRTDGSRVEGLGEPIRQTILTADASANDVRVGYSPDDGLVYFILSPGGANSYHLALIFNHRTERWMKSIFYSAASTPVEFGALAFLDSIASPAPSAAPSSLVATSAGDAEINLTWTNGDSSVDTTTHIYRSLSNGFTPDDATNLIASVGSGVAAYADSGLSPETPYYYKLKHVRNAQHSSESSQATATTWLAPPTSVGLAGITNGLTISGTNPSTGANIRIEYHAGDSVWTLVTTLTTPGASFSHDHTGLSCGTVYYYRTRTEKAGFTSSEWSASVSRAACEATSPPADPSGFSATTASSTQIDLAWTDNSDNEDSFVVEQSLNGSDWSVIANKSPNSTSHSVTGLSSNTLYYFRLKATNTYGASNYVSDSSTTSPDLDAPTSLTATASSTSQIDLTWVDNATDESGFQIWFSTDAGSTWGLHGTASANATAYSATGLSSGTAYLFKVRAALGGVYGSYSSTAGDTTFGATLLAPSNLTVTKNVGSPTDTIDLAWTDNSPDEEGFQIYRSTDDISYSLVHTTAAGVEAWQDTPVSQGTTYYYKVRAFNNTYSPPITSAYSNTDWDTTDGTQGVPTTPTSLTATSNPSDPNGNQRRYIDVAWTDNADNETSYVLERAKWNGTGWDSWISRATLAANTESFQDNIAVPTTYGTDTFTYKYRVKAVNGTGDSTYSNEDSATTEADVGVFNLTPSDSSYCAGLITPTPRVKLQWVNGDVDGLVTRSILRSTSPSGGYSSIGTALATDTTYYDEAISFGVTYYYKISDDFGTTGDNTGVFTTSATTGISTSEPTCTPPE